MLFWHQNKQIEPQTVIKAISFFEEKDMQPQIPHRIGTNTKGLSYPVLTHDSLFDQ